MQKHMNDDFQKLISNQKFIDWVKNPNPELDEYWENIVLKKPKLKDEIIHAKYIIKRLIQKKQELKNKDIQKLWLNIQSKTIGQPRKRIVFKNLKLVASILLVIGLSCFVFYQFSIKRNNYQIDYQSIAQKEQEGSEIKLVLSDNSQKLINSKKPIVKYNKNGEITIDSILLKKKIKPSKEVIKEVFNQIIVPKGKRTDLMLSDGTRIFLNSGSRVIYPVKFNKKKREIYIQGEAYLEVIHHADWPFIVKTNHIKVKDLGTEFDIKSYADEDNTSVILVKGSIQTIIKSKKILMHRGELLTLAHKSGNTSIKNVDTSDYVSWKDGWLICNNECLESIATKLSRYFNVNIQFQDPKIKDFTMSGKLDLKSECSQVLDIIKFSAPIDYKEINGNIILTLKRTRNVIQIK